MENYSVLMSVYHGEQPEFFRQSVESMLTQSVQTDDFVLVCDGPLTTELEEVTVELKEKLGSRLQLVKLPENRGLAKALNAGLAVCRHELIARMDSDDVAEPERCRMQLETFAKRPELAVAGGDIVEFEGNTENTVSRKTMPRLQPQILRYAKKRNPFNHPTVMFRKSAVQAVGGYPEGYPFQEDYALWAQLLLEGYEGCNLPQVLVKMRIGSGFYDRRGGSQLRKSGLALRRDLYQKGFYGFWNYLFVSSAFALSCMMGRGGRKLLYRSVLRKKA